ncbi:hypothetical protein DE146DRAFT_752930 [Phaeosphaeria sp. MPI-PUGE-AT-0046c]|nr:hypothetical protein DE146DRAFT_752930 [Phaeosphaeria sp. MPI-PUGE-AT-0046c]
MHFTPIFLPLLVSLAQGTPAPIVPPFPAPICARNVADTDLIAESIVYSVESAKCKILKCAAVIATAACILGAIPDIDTTLACVKGKADKLCSCAGCVHKLNDWLVEYGVCDGNSTAIAAA